MAQSTCCTKPSTLAPRQHGVAWSQVVRALRSYQQRRGTLDVAPTVRAHGVELGRCVIQCRRDYWNGLLDDDAVATLQGIPGWSWGSRPERCWLTALQGLRRYARSHGSTVLTKRVVRGGVDLQDWCASQRAAAADGRLAASQVAALELLPDWTWDPDEYRWQQGLAVLDRFLTAGGDLAAVHAGTEVHGYPLGRWLERCRQDYRTGDISPQRRDALKALVNWTYLHDPWEGGYQSLLRFVAVHGHAHPGQRMISDGYRIGWWVTRQRHDFRRGRLDDDRIRRLHALPGWEWDPADARWREGMLALTHYAQEYGQADPPRNQQIDGFPVGAWAQSQRYAYHRQRLNLERTQALQTLPGWRWNRATATIEATH